MRPPAKSLGQIDDGPGVIPSRAAHVAPVGKDARVLSFERDSAIEMLKRAVEIGEIEERDAVVHLGLCLLGERRVLATLASGRGSHQRRVYASRVERALMR